MKLVISTMRDEGPYLLEWLAYHRVIGFDAFLIYTNDCRDGTDLLLDRLEQNGLVTHVRNRVLKRGPHKSALKYAQEHPLYAEADWVYVTDVDEFLNIRAGDGLVDDLIAAQPDATVIPVAWRMFSNNHRADLNGELVTAALDDCEPEEPHEGEKGRFVKSLFRPCDDVERMGLHAPVFRDEDDGLGIWRAPWLSADPAADPRRPARDFGYEIAQVNHYAVRSVNAYLFKRDRGRANHVGEDLGIGYWTRWCRGGAEDRSIQRHLPAVCAELDRLSADPVVDALWQGARAYHAKRLETLLREESYRALRDDILAQSGTPVPEPSAADPTEALAVKAPKRHQNRLRMLERMPKGGRCAEIGVWNGGFSGAILEVTKPSELVLIDPWDLLADKDAGEWTHKKHEDRAAMRGMYDNVVQRFGDLANVLIRRGFSADVLDSFPDAYFDWVYIDGNHLYDFVKRDVEMSFRKVRPGGIIAGDDFFWKRGDRMHVREAVLDAMREQGMPNRPTRIGQQYMITVPGG